jgi:endonuclease-3
VSGATDARHLEPAEKILRVLHALDEYYGRKKRSEAPDPLRVLVRGILSQNTSDVNSGRAYESLMRQFGGWAELAQAGRQEIERAIRSGGLAAQKAGAIKSVMDWLAGRGEYSLDFLDELGSGEVEERLKRIKGVGIKTARLVLLFGLARPVFVVDTHVHRVSRRLGLIPSKSSRRKAHGLLDGLIPDEDKYSGHLNMIEHGRRTCRAQSPLCDGCTVRRWCLHVSGEVQQVSPS